MRPLDIDALHLSEMLAFGIGDRAVIAMCAPPPEDDG